MEAQDLANQIGVKVREAEDAARINDMQNAVTALEALHDLLGQAFKLANDEYGADLDWDQIAGGTAARGGTPKTKPE